MEGQNRSIQYSHLVMWVFGGDLVVRGHQSGGPWLDRRGGRGQRRCGGGQRVVEQEESEGQKEEEEALSFSGDDHLCIDLASLRIFTRNYFLSIH